MRTARWIILTAGILVLMAPAAMAQVSNGDFEAGGTDWQVTQPANWSVTFPPGGGNPNGYARIMSPFGDSQGIACVSQTFVCGDNPDAVCIITLDVQLTMIDAGPNTGRIIVQVDGVEEYVSPSTDVPWTTITIIVPCGTHTIDLCLQVDTGNHGWAACFDNVRAECDESVSSEHGTWSGIKGLYD
jgi:hypothetical protein